MQTNCQADCVASWLGFSCYQLLAAVRYLYAHLPDTLNRRMAQLPSFIAPLTSYLPAGTYLTFQVLAQASTSKHNVTLAACCQDQENCARERSKGCGPGLPYCKCVQPGWACTYNTVCGTGRLGLSSAGIDGCRLGGSQRAISWCSCRG